MHKWFLFVLLFAAMALAEKITIVKIIDTNLFQLKDGRLICLANIKTLSRFHRDSTHSYLVNDILKFEQKRFFSNNITATFSTVKTDSSCNPVYLFEKFPLQTLNFNKIFLEKNFATFIANADSGHNAFYGKIAEQAYNSSSGNYVRQGEQHVNWSDYNFSLFGGYWEPAEDETNYEFAVQLSPLKNITGFKFSLGMIRRSQKGSGCCDCAVDYYTGTIPTYNFISYNIYSSAELDINGQYAGFSIGGYLLELQRGYCNEMPDGLIGFPKIALRLGLMNKLFLSLDQPMYTLPYFLGINYLFNRPGTSILLAVSNLRFLHYGEDENGIIYYMLKVNYGLNKNYILKIQGYYLDAEQPKRGFRLGIGRRILR